MIDLTNSAKEKLTTLLKNQEPNTCIRFGVKGGGCSGFSYFLELDDISNKDNSDEIIEFETFKLIIDGPSIMYIIGTTIDWQESLLESKFVFNSPKKSSSCGCGSSVNFKL